jgi:hypothetical protein
LTYVDRELRKRPDIIHRQEIGRLDDDETEEEMVASLLVVITLSPSLSALLHTSLQSVQQQSSIE